MREFTLYDLFVRNAVNFSKSTALVTEEARISHAELLGHSNSLATKLAGFGVSEGDRVAVLAMNHPGFFILFGALAKLGAILVPLNWRLSEDELSYILSDSAPRLLFADQNFLARAREIAEPLDLRVLKIEHGLEEEPVPSPPAARAAVERDTPLCIIYTAAVEGYPRGAVLSHGNLLSANLQVIVSMGLGIADVNLNMLPLFHITGINLALSVLQLGGKNVIIEKFDEESTIRFTLAEEVTLWGSFPPILGRMVAQIKERQLSLPSLKYAVGLDGPDSIAEFEEVTNAKFWILYGQSETSGFVTFSPASERTGSAGRQGPLSTFILGDGSDQPVAQGETGEILVRGPLVFQGYWNQVELNERTFRNGWHHTGDLGQLDVDGYLIYKGRKPEKELIKPGGENVYPAEVEAVILQHADITDVSVIGVPDPKFGEGVKAVCVLRPGAVLEPGELIEFVGSKIARYKKPGYVQFVDALPKTDGATDREEVKNLYG